MNAEAITVLALVVLSAAVRAVRQRLKPLPPPEISSPSIGGRTAMSKYARFLPLVLLACYLLFKIVPYIPRPDSSPDGHEPTKAQQRLLEPVQETLEDYPDAAKEFASLYYGMALVVGADEVILKTTDDVRRAHENAGALAIQSGEIPRIPGYAKAVNDFLTEEIGRDNVPLDSQKRKQIVDAFKGLAWATNQ